MQIVRLYFKNIVKAQCECQKSYRLGLSFIYQNSTRSHSHGVQSKRVSCESPPQFRESECCKMMYLDIQLAPTLQLKGLNG